MKKNSSSILRILSLALIIITCIINNSSIHAQDSTLQEIKTILLNNPPNSGDREIRQQTLLSLDDMLKYAPVNSQEVFEFYVSMIKKVKAEIEEEVSEGIKIWMMYNHGFIIKTPEIVFAFDLIDYCHFSLSMMGIDYRLPKEILDQIDILFLTHEHVDHWDVSVELAVMNNVGKVIWGSFGRSFSISGLQVTVHEGLHSAPNRIYEVTTSNNIKIIHTGDNQTSTTLPFVKEVDVLLLNGWVNESGTTDATTGMNNCILKLKPELMIPGHFHELGHQIYQRYLYQSAIDLPDYSFTNVEVMAWGELYNFTKKTVRIEGDEKYLLESDYKLSQNYPNPFNPSTTIKYSIPKQSNVTIKVFDVLGSEVATLENREQTQGKYEVEFDGNNLTSGIYLYRLQAGDFVETRKMILLK